MRRSPLGRKRPEPRHAAQVPANTDLSRPSENLPPRRKPVRQTGFPPPVRKLIDHRDSDHGSLPAGFIRCQACGRVLPSDETEIQHRVARHMGGTRNPAISSVINGIRLCRMCHRAAEGRNVILYDRGFWRPQSDIGHLELIPVVRWDRRAYYPTTDGRWLLEAPAGEVP